jgi:hypothetical protein
MTSLNFGSAGLGLIPRAGLGHQRLRRRASAPELADPKKIIGNTTPIYQAGNTIRLQLVDRNVRAKIVKAFTPFTMAQVMLVQIFEPALDLEGTYVLKIYDRCHSTTMRERDDQWTITRDMEFEKRRWPKGFVDFFLHLMDYESLSYMGEDYVEDEYDDVPGLDESFSSSEDESDNSALLGEKWATEEGYYQATCLKMYRAELEAYRRARQHKMDGIDVPRFISSVRIPHGYTSKHCQVTMSGITEVPGILMQYLPGFSLTDLYDTPSPPPPSEDWKSIIDDGLRIVQYYVQKMKMHNMDSCIARNTVVHWDPIGQKWKCKLIDFGHFVFKRTSTREWGWRLRQSCPEAEQAIAGDMAWFLKDKKGFQYTWKPSLYSAELVRDFLTEDMPREEPICYISLEQGEKPTVS